MIIGVNGNKGSGKDTVGQYLVDNYGFERLSFAAKLKESAAALFEVDPSVWEELKNDKDARVILEAPSDVFDGKWAKIDIDVRTFLQRYGTEAHRDIFGYDFWVEALLGDYQISEKRDFVVTDARFDNELYRIQVLDGLTVRIERPGTEGDGHASEIPPRKELIDYTINNSGTLEDLYASVDDFMATFALISPKNVASFKA